MDVQRLDQRQRVYEDLTMHPHRVLLIVPRVFILIQKVILRLGTAEFCELTNEREMEANSQRRRPRFLSVLWNI